MTRQDKQRLEHVSGWMLAVTAIGLQVAAAWVSDDPSRSAIVVKWSAWITTAAAVWVIFVAQYDAWREERKRAEEESAKNLKPQIDGQITDFRKGSAHGTSILDGEHYRHTQFSCKLLLTNRRQVTTNITGYALVGFECSPVIAFFNLVMSPPNVEVTYAKGSIVNLSGIAQIKGESATEEKVSLDGLYAVVLDGFRDSHAIQIECPGNYIVFPPTPSVRPDDASAAEPS